MTDAGIRSGNCISYASPSPTRVKPLHGSSKRAVLTNEIIFYDKGIATALKSLAMTAYPFFDKQRLFPKEQPFAL